MTEPLASATPVRSNRLAPTIAFPNGVWERGNLLKFVIRVRCFILTFLALLCYLPDTYAADQIKPLDEAKLKQTDLGAYFESIQFADNKLLLVMHSSGTRYLVKGADRATNYGEVLAVARNGSLELIDKHGGLQLTSQNTDPGPTFEVETYFNASDFGGTLTKKFYLIHVDFPGGHPKNLQIVQLLLNQGSSR